MNYLHCSLLSLEYRETKTETAFKTSHLKQSDIYHIEKKILSKIGKKKFPSDIRVMLFLSSLKLCTFNILHWLLNFAGVFFFSLKIIRISSFHYNYIYDNIMNLRKHFISILVLLSQTLLCFSHQLQYFFFFKMRCTYDSKNL